MIKMRLLSSLLALGLSFGAGLEASPKPGEAADISILPGWRMENGRYMTALRVRLDDGWKTYWRAPGEAGIPPSFDWSGSDNLGGVTLHWPVPSVFHTNGMRTIGYANELVLPMELTPRGPGPMRLKAELQIGVCRDICMPMTVDLSALLSGAGAHDPRITDALGDQAARGTASAACAIEPISDGLRVRADIALPALGGDEVAVFEMPDSRIWIAEALSQRRGGTLSAVTEMVPPSGRPFLLNRSDMRITVLGGGRAVQIDGCSGG